MMRLRYLARRAKAKVLRREYYYIDGLALESSLKRAAPKIHSDYLSQVRGAAGSLMGALVSTVQAVFLPHFVVPAIVNVTFLGHYSLRIHTMREWAKANGIKLARRCEIIAHILYGIIIKLCVTALTFNHADFALIGHALSKVADGLGNASELVAVLDRLQADWANIQAVSGLNAGLGAALGAPQNSIGLGGDVLEWRENLSPAQITELALANQAGDFTAQATLEQPMDKAIGVGENTASRTFDSQYGEQYPDPRREAYTPAVVSTQRPYGSLGHAGSSDNDESNSNSTFETHSDTDSSADDVAIDASLGSDSCASYSTPSSFKLLSSEEFRDTMLRNAEEDLNKKTLVAQVSALGALTSVVLGGLWYFLG